MCHTFCIFIEELSETQSEVREVKVQIMQLQGKE